MWLSATELLDALPDPLFVVDRAWQIVYVNDRALELWRMPRDSLIGRNHWEVFPQAVGTHAWRELHRSMAARTPIELEARSVVFGEWVEVRTFPVREGLLVQFREIAQRKRQEEELAHVVELARQKIVPIVGLDYKDKDDLGKAWLADRGNPYMASVVDADGRVGIDWGVYGVPETFVVDKAGIIRYKQIGPVDAEALRKTIVPLVRELQKS